MLTYLLFVSAFLGFGDTEFGNTAPGSTAPGNTAPTEQPPATVADAELEATFDEASLDEELLKELSDETSGDETPDADSGDADAAGEEGAQQDQDLDDELFRGMADGEDIGAEGEEPLSRIGREMRQAEDLLRQARSDETTQTLQGEIVAQLEALIKQAQQQQQQQQQDEQEKKKRQKMAQRKKVKPQQPKSGRQQASQQSKKGNQSSDELRPDELHEVDMQAANDTIKRWWGNLPPKLRDEMQNAVMAGFLQKYRELTEEYFKTLAKGQE